RHKRARVDERVHRARAEGLHVAPGRVAATSLLGDGLAEVAAAALVAVADGFLATADRVLHFLGGETRRFEQVLEREGPGRLAGEVFEEDRGREALVELVRPEHDARSVAVSVDGE